MYQTTDLRSLRLVLRRSWRCTSSPERTLSTKCSLFPSCRGVMYHRLNGEMTEMDPLVQHPFTLDGLFSE